MLYTFRVIKSSNSFMTILCLALLSMQVSGLHMHASLEGNVGLHGTHVHGVGPDGHDRESETDVSFLEFSIGWVKHFPLLILFISAFLAIVVFSKHVWAPVTKTIRALRYPRWRPPLRAPPSLVS
jgi:hypothetical protein